MSKAKTKVLFVILAISFLMFPYHFLSEEVYGADNSYTLIKLDTPANLAVTGTVLSWDKVENADDYYVEIGVGTEESYTSSGVMTGSGDITTYDFQEKVSDLMSSGGYANSDELYLHVRMNAETSNPEVYSNSDSATLVIPLSETGISIQKPKLDTPANLAVSGVVLSWDKVENADDYYIEIGVGTEKSYISSGVMTGSGDITTYDFQEKVSDLMSSGGYVNSDELYLHVRMNAVASNSETYSNSDSATLVIPLFETGISIRKTKLDTPSDLKLENTVFSWDKVENADYYYVEVTLWKDGKGHTVSSGDGRLTTESIDVDSRLRSTLSSAGYTSFSGVKVELEVQACSDNTDLYANSDTAKLVKYEYQGAHDWDEDYTVDKKPTCLEEGSKSIHCKTCDERKSITTIPADGHTYSDCATTKVATCKEAGSKSIHCSVCGEIKEGSIQVIPKLTTHKYGAWKTTTAATEIAAGQRTRTCSVCGNAEKQSIAMLRPTLPSVKIAKPKASKKSATFKWKKVSKKNRKKIGNIQIQYSTDKSFRTGVKTVTAKKTASSKKVKKLVSKKKYYVRVRAYKKTGNTVHVSAWSGVKAVKVK